MASSTFDQTMSSARAVPEIATPATISSPSNRITHSFLVLFSARFFPLRRR
jgi:hypothetical protein